MQALASSMMIRYISSQVTPHCCFIPLHEIWKLNLKLCVFFSWPGKLNFSLIISTQKKRWKEELSGKNCWNTIKLHFCSGFMQWLTALIVRHLSLWLSGMKRASSAGRWVIWIDMTSTRYMRKMVEKHAWKWDVLNVTIPFVCTLHIDNVKVFISSCQW